MVCGTMDVIEPNESTDVGHQLILEMDSLVTDNSAWNAVSAKILIEECDGGGVGGAIWKSDCRDIARKIICYNQDILVIPGVILNGPQ